MQYSVQPREQISVKGYRFLTFAKNIGRNIGKNINKSLSGKYSQNFSIMLHNLQQMHLKLLLKKQFKKTVEATGDLIDNKTADRIQKNQKLHNKIIQKQL